MKTRFLNITNFSIAFLCLWTPLAQAKLVEEVIKVPVKVFNTYGKAFERDIVVTVHYDNAQPKPYPIAIINHGRAAKPEERANFGRATNITNARWLAAMGFMVASPTRFGYGDTGGYDVEDSGTCNNKKYPPSYEAAAAQTEYVLSALQQRTDTVKDRSLVIGQSFGGATTIAVAAKNLPGVLTTINFAGGGGGNPETNPLNPCGSNHLKAMFATYGETAKTPTLWVYTENDQWMGPKYPKEWFEAYKAKSGTGEFLLLPPNGTDGHGVFARDPAAWRVQVLQFIKANGFPDLKEVETNK